MEWQKLEGTWKGGKQWSHLTTLWRRLQDLLVAIFAIIAWDSVADLAALAALENMGNGSARYVRSLRATFILDTASVAVADGITVVGALGGGNWIRQAQVDPHWSLQSTWYIDPTTGDDENSGGIAAPLLTLSEFGRRVQNLTIQQTTTVNVLSDALPTDTLDLTCNLALDAGLFIVGTLTVDLESVVTAWTKDIGSVGPNNNDIGSLTLGAWTVADHVGKLVTFTDGPAVGGWGWISFDQGAGVARVSTITTCAPPNVEGAIVAPAVGNTARVCSMPAVNVSSITVNGMRDVYTSGLGFQDIYIRPNGGALEASNLSGSALFLLRCKCEQATIQSGVISGLVQCSGFFTVASGYVVVSAGVFTQFDMQDGFVAARHDIIVDSDFPDTHVFMPDINVAHCRWINTGGTGVYGDAWGYYVWAFGGVACHDRMFGNTTGVGIGLEPGATVILDHDDVNTLVTGITDVEFELNPAGTLSFTWAQVPYANPHTGARVLSHHTPGQNYLGGAPSPIKVGVKGAVTAAVGPGATNFILRDLTENGATELPDVMNQNCILANLFAHMGTGPSAIGDSVTLSVLVNGVATPLTCVIGNGETAASDQNSNHRVIVVPGDRVSIRCTAIDADGGGFTGANLSVSLEAA